MKTGIGSAERIRANSVELERVEADTAAELESVGVNLRLLNDLEATQNHLVQAECCTGTFALEY